MPVKTLKAYYWLAKPGIIYGNLLAACAGFFIASRLAPGVYWALLVETAAAIGLIIGSACAFNNYIDRGIDRKMKRTSWRALASDTLPVGHALAFATLLGVLVFAPSIVRIGYALQRGPSYIATMAWRAFSVRLSQWRSV